MREETALTARAAASTTVSQLRATTINRCGRTGATTAAAATKRRDSPGRRPKAVRRRRRPTDSADVVISIRFVPESGKINRLWRRESTKQQQRNPPTYLSVLRIRILEPGSGAFLTPGSGIWNRFFEDPGSRISDPKPIYLRAY